MEVCLRQTALAFALIVALAVPAEAQQVRILEAAVKLAAETPLAAPQTDNGCSPAPTCAHAERQQRPGRDATWALLAISAAVVVAVVMSDGVRRPEPDGYGLATPGRIQISN